MCSRGRNLKYSALHRGSPVLQKLTLPTLRGHHIEVLLTSSCALNPRPKARADNIGLLDVLLNETIDFP